VKLLRVDHTELPGRVAADPLHVLGAGEAPLVGGLDDLPGRRLVGVVLRGGRPHHVRREATAERLEILSFLGQREIHLARYLLAATGRPPDRH
jgi:hypothetical protein